MPGATSGDEKNDEPQGVETHEASRDHLAGSHLEHGGELEAEAVPIGLGALGSKGFQVPFEPHNASMSTP